MHKSLFPGPQGGLGARENLALGRNLWKVKTNPLWLSEPLSHLLSYGEGLAVTAFWFSFK